MPILAIDLGTSNVKAAVVTAAGDVCGHGSRPVAITLTDDGGAEQDAEAVWTSVLEAAEDALDASGLRSEIEGVACTSQYSSIVPVDNDARPTSPIVLWMDQRGSPNRLEAIEGGRGMKPNPLRLVRWVSVHGVPPLSSGADSLAHMRWIKLARPEAYRKTATFLEPMDYLTARLCGRRVANRCTAFMTLLTDNRRGAKLGYHPKLLRWSQIDRDKLPELVELGTPLGTVRAEVADQLGIPRSAVVFPGLNDTQAGGVGSYAFSGEHVGISIGTTGVVITHVDFKKTDLFNSMTTMPSPVPGKNFVLAEAGISGKAIEHFLNRFVFADDAFGSLSDAQRFAALEEAVRGAPAGSGGVMFLPWLSGSQAPAEDSLVRGGFLNISLTTTREHLARAVLEGVALNLRWVLSRVERFARRPASHVVLYGGGAGSAVWPQILADVLGLEVQRVSEPAFAACRGVALLGYACLGQLETGDIESRVSIESRFSPEEGAAATFDPLFEQFVLAFKRNRSIFRSINAHT